MRASTARNGSFEAPIGPEELAAAVAEQKRIALDPALFAAPVPAISRQGRHEVSLRILAGGERVKLRVAVGAAAAAAAEGGGGGAAEGGKKKKGG